MATLLHLRKILFNDVYINIIIICKLFCDIEPQKIKDHSGLDLSMFGPRWGGPQYKSDGGDHPTF